jgi:hypothetical protein
MLGDTAVAVNPKDPDRANFIGRHVRLPIVNRVIPIVGDDYVVIPDPDSSDEKARFASRFPQGHPGPRSERLRDRPTPRPAHHQRHGTRWFNQ